MIYRVTTIFTDKVSIFKHPKKKYAIESSIRNYILDPLNTCIASYQNFQRRSELLGLETSFVSNNMLEDALDNESHLAINSK